MNPYLINLNFLQIRWYSVIMLIAIGLAVFMFYNESRKSRLPKIFIENLVFYSLLVGIIGARAYYVTFNWYSYRTDPVDIFKIWEGGLAIHGGIITGAIFMYWYTKKYKRNPLKLYDITVVSLIIGQIIGRFGNFMNGEAYGQITTRAELLKQGIPRFIIEGMHINGLYYQPTFLYESMWNLIGLFILLITRWKLKIKVGTLTCIYLVWYGLGRFLIESLRADSLIFRGLRVAQLISVIMIVTGIYGYIYLRNKRKRPLYHTVHKQDEIETLDV